MSQDDKRRDRIDVVYHGATTWVRPDKPIKDKVESIPAMLTKCPQELESTQLEDKLELASVFVAIKMSK